MDVLSHSDVKAGATPEATALATNDALGGIVARAVCLLVNGLLSEATQLPGFCR